MILCFTSALFSCEKDNILVEDSYGTTLHTIEHYTEGNWESTETYWYSNQGELTEVTQAYPSYVDKHQVNASIDDPRFGQVSRLVHITASHNSDMIGK